MRLTKEEIEVLHYCVEEVYLMYSDDMEQYDIELYNKLKNRLQDKLNVKRRNK
jgi:hypothetical protein